MSCCLFDDLLSWVTLFLCLCCHSADIADICAQQN
jgi:hypothetical protein